MSSCPAWVNRISEDTPVLAIERALHPAVILQPTQQDTDGVLADILAAAEITGCQALGLAVAFFHEQPKQKAPARAGHRYAIDLALRLAGEQVAHHVDQPNQLEPGRVDGYPELAEELLEKPPRVGLAVHWPTKSQLSLPLGNT